MALLKAPIRSLQLLATFIWLLYGLALVENCPKAGGLNATCIEKERQALLKFRRGLVVDSAELLSEWSNESMDCCRWEGIQCGRSGHVVGLDLGGLVACEGVRGYCQAVRIRGEIGPSLLDLPYLKYLDLSQNDFTRIPVFIGAVKRLRYLNLSSNLLVGIVPHQIGNLSALESFDLSYNVALEVDSMTWVSRLSSLKYLNMNTVHLISVKDWVDSITRIPSLTRLYLRDCHLSLRGAPTNANSSRSLEVLDLRWNYIDVAALSPWLNNSVNLVELSAVSLGSPQGPIPNYLFNLISIQHLDLSYNSFEGEIPKAFSNLSNLLTLDLSWNKLNKSSSFFQSGSDSLRELYIDHNTLSGSLPELSMFPSLEVLKIGGNRYGGSLEQLLGQSSYLTILDVSSNLFGGVLVEDQFLNLSKLEVLSLSSNSLTLNFSAWWAAPFQLRAVSLRDCKLGPSFPHWLKTQKNLTGLDISNCGISDVVPSWFWNISSRLNYLNISHNSISGTMQNSLPFCNFIDLSFNRFHGHIPSLDSEVDMLDLSNNRFSGNISFLCSLKEWLYTLDLSDNLFTGSLPSCLKRFHELALLNLNSNNFLGHIPSSIGNLIWIRILSFRNNSLTGELPPDLKKCQDLELLDFGQNQLTGQIPSWIGTSLTNLLSLKSNRFEGNIPSALCLLNSIQILDFSFNKIFGAIPSCLNNFTAMSSTTSQYYPLIYVYGDLDLNWQEVFTTLVAWKGLNREFVSEKNLELLNLIDLSSNRLTGPIPKEITSLYELVSLNLSRNNLSGTIPDKIGQLTMLDSLDLSNNLLSGQIPWSMTNFSTLGYLNLSYNNLSGHVPTSTQLQGFTATEFIGNPGLCGPPLTNPCRGNEILYDTPITDVHWEHEIKVVGWFRENLGFCVSILLGFIVGFWGVSGTLVLKSSWREKYFQILNLKIFVPILVGMVNLKRRFLS